MAKVVSCGVVMLNARRELFVCHATGTARWDLPKGLQEPGESALQTAVREAWEETSLELEPGLLEDLGLHDYLPAKRLHLFALRVAVDAFPIRDCRCHSTFPHHATGLPTLEVDAYAWKSVDRLGDWCGKNMTKVLLALDWRRIETLPEVASVKVRIG
ncbi:NUDIX hydrolase [Variovorax sp. GT1P44]|uniref:NUDIX hydrolase n=1 Tax=Variovorax sp. GT1P44 TaxID=3443742 RepID=UPI003F4781C4